MLYTDFQGNALSRLALGTWVNFGGKASDNENKSILDACLNAGMNVIDTAASYEEGRAETLLGKWITPTLRKNFFLCTKTFLPPEAPTREVNKNALNASFDACLRRLKTDYIDLFYLHRFDETMALEDIACCFGGFIKSGKLRYWGVSKWPLDKLQELMDACEEQNVPLPSAMQEPHNYLYPLSADRIDFAREHSMKLFLFSPLARGVLTGKYIQNIPLESRGANASYKTSLGGMESSPNPRTKPFMNLAQFYNLTPVQLAYFFVLQSVPESIMLCGFSEAEQVSVAKEMLKYDNIKVHYD